MTMIDRNSVYKKYNGHCAYCGKSISIKEMQIDHLIPKSLFDDTRNLFDVEMNGIDNLMPSCRRCNHYKRAHTLELFRRLLLDMKRKVLDDTYLGKIAMDYGMVTWNGWDGKFYFEKMNEEDKNG